MHELGVKTPFSFFSVQLLRHFVPSGVCLTKQSNENKYNLSLSGNRTHNHRFEQSDPVPLRHDGLNL